MEKLDELGKQCNFPWLMSNVFLEENGERNLISGAKESIVIHHQGLKIGLIGIVEK